MSQIKSNPYDVNVDLDFAKEVTQSYRSKYKDVSKFWNDTALNFISAVLAQYCVPKPSPKDYLELFELYKAGKDFKILSGPYMSIRDADYIFGKYDYIILCYQKIRCKVRRDNEGNLYATDGI